MAPTDAPVPQIIQGYGGGMFRISDVVHSHSVIVLPTRTLPWPPARVSEIDEQSLRPVFDQAEQIDILLLGSGNSMQLTPTGIQEICRARAVVIEVMDTGAACRTYNLLAGEKRRVAAALIALT